MKELIIPPAALQDANSTEMVRLWAAQGEQHISLNIGSYEENGHNEAQAWGIICADFIFHVANALSQRYGKDYQDTVDQIRSSLLNELERPTTGVNGQ